MFAVNDTVQYGTTGPCTIVDIRPERLGTAGGGTYYILRPVFQKDAVIYVPVDNPTLTAKMRTMLTAEEIYALIRSMPAVPEEWITDDAARSEAFRAALRSGDRRQLVALIKSVYSRRQELAGSGRHLRSSDAALMKEAETLLYNEFAYVLHIEPDQVLPLILQELN